MSIYMTPSLAGTLSVLQSVYSDRPSIAKTQCVQSQTIHCKNTVYTVTEQLFKNTIMYTVLIEHPLQKQSETHQQYNPDITI